MSVKYLIALLVLAVDGNSVDPCQTPNGQNGDCKPINQCQPLFVHFQRRGHISNRTATFLKKSMCGLVGTYPKVCCPLGSSLPPPAMKGVVEKSSLLPNETYCGISTSNKIVGGTATELNEFPWMALLEYQNSKGERNFRCDGFLISKRYVLTAAHCLIWGLVSVRLGEYNTDSGIDCIENYCAPPPLNVLVEKTVAYKSNDSDQLNDIGLIRLTQEVEYSDYIKPICLPITNDEIDKSYLGEKLTVAGWGITEIGVRSSTKLKVQVPVKELSGCVRSYNLPVGAGQLCAGGEAGKDVCIGDSGGPLMTIKRSRSSDMRWYAIGVVSYGSVPCKNATKPGLYTKVAKYVSWIVNELKP